MIKKQIVLVTILCAVFITGCSVKVAMPSENDNTADEHYMEYLKGNEPDSEGDFIYDYEAEAEAEYALTDLNNDGQNELLIRTYGYFIPDIIEYKDDKITHLYVDNCGSAGVTFINSKDQYVGGDTTHAGRDYYWISEIDDQKNANTVLFFGMEYEEYDETKEQTFYKLENPTKDYSYDDWEEISESEYESLVEEYTQEKSLEWNKI